MHGVHPIQEDLSIYYRTSRTDLIRSIMSLAKHMLAIINKLTSSLVASVDNEYSTCLQPKCPLIFETKHEALSDLRIAIPGSLGT